MSKWWFKADYIEACNCAHGCPCNTTQLPTQGGCEAIVGYRIRKGAFDDVSLGGITLGYVGYWPGPIHRGNGQGVVFIDENANEAQRSALEAIATGQAGPGGCFEIFASTMLEPPTVMVGPIEFELDGNRGKLKFGDIAYANVGPILGDMEGAEANARMILPDGFIWRDSLLVNTDEGEAKTPNFSFSLRDSNAFFSDVAYNV
jgi:hypothetical protein